MIWLSNSTLQRLRDQLRERGQRPSIAVGGGVSAEVAEGLAISAEYGALTEAMYLMMSADGHVTDDEREVLRGALRALSTETIRGVHIEALLDAAAKQVAAQGREARLADVIAQLGTDPARAEVAFVLAAGDRVRRQRHRRPGERDAQRARRGAGDRRDQSDGLAARRASGPDLQAEQPGT